MNITAQAEIPNGNNPREIVKALGIPLHLGLDENGEPIGELQYEIEDNTLKINGPMQAELDAIVLTFTPAWTASVTLNGVSLKYLQEALGVTGFISEDIFFAKGPTQIELDGAVAAFDPVAYQAAIEAETARQTDLDYLSDTDKPTARLAEDLYTILVANGTIQEQDVSVDARDRVISRAAARARLA